MKLFFKKAIHICLLVSMLFYCSACSKGNKDVTTNNPSSAKVITIQTSSMEETESFLQDERGRLISSSGVEYSFLGHELELVYVGELVFKGYVQGESKILHHMDSEFQTGLFAIKGDETENILVRTYPDSEWRGIYRKSSLPEFDISVDNCIRLEWVPYADTPNGHINHENCGKCIVGRAEVKGFISDIRAQKDPSEAGLYDLVTKPNGWYENCYQSFKLYGFFEEEPTVAVEMAVYSYNDWAYSISILQEDYVLPQKWTEKFIKE